MAEHNHEQRIKGTSSVQIVLGLTSIALLVWLLFSLPASALPVGIAWFAINIASAIVTHDASKDCCR